MQIAGGLDLMGASILTSRYCHVFVRHRLVTDTQLAVLSQCGLGSSVIAFNDDGCNDPSAPSLAADPRSRLTIQLTAGITYSVYIAGWQASDKGLFTLTISTNDPTAAPTLGPTAVGAVSRLCF